MEEVDLGCHQRGDCSLENGTLQINADGTAIFWGFASTSDDDDAWVFRGGISLLDVHGTVLWTSGKLVGPHSTCVGRNLRMGSPIQLPRGVVRLQPPERR